jgi:hypothetical protein
MTIKLSPAVSLSTARGSKVAYNLCQFFDNCRSFIKNEISESCDIVPLRGRLAAEVEEKRLCGSGGGGWGMARMKNIKSIRH